MSRDYKDAQRRCHARSHAINIGCIFARKFHVHVVVTRHTACQDPSERPPLYFTDFLAIENFTIVSFFLSFFLLNFVSYRMELERFEMIDTRVSF